MRADVQIPAGLATRTIAASRTCTRHQLLPRRPAICNLQSAHARTHSQGILSCCLGPIGCGVSHLVSPTGPAAALLMLYEVPAVSYLQKLYVYLRTWKYRTGQRASTSHTSTRTSLCLVNKGGPGRALGYWASSCPPASYHRTGTQVPTDRNTCSSVLSPATG